MAERKDSDFIEMPKENAASLPYPPDNPPARPWTLFFAEHEDGRPPLRHLRHEQAVGHPLLEVPNHVRLGPRHRDREHVAHARAERIEVSAA
jgi:hypothetical protein